MADPGAPTLESAFGGLVNTINQLPENLSAFSMELESAKNKFRDGMMTVEDLNSSFRTLVSEVLRSVRDNEKLRDSLAAIISGINEADRALREEAKQIRDTDKASKELTQGLKSAGESALAFATGLGGTTGSEMVSNSKNLVSSLTSMVSAVGLASGQLEVVAGAQVIGGLIKGVIGMTEAVDKVAKTHFPLAQILAQSAVGFQNHGREVRESAISLAKLGGHFGMTAEEVKGTIEKLTDFGVSLGKTKDGIVTVQSEQEGYAKDLVTARSAQLGMGIGADQAADAMEIFRVRLGMSTEQAQVAFGETNAVIKGLGVQARPFVRNMESLAESTKEYGLGEKALITTTGVYNDALLRETISMKDVISMTNIQTKSVAEQVGWVEVLRQKFPELNKQIGLTNDQFANVAIWNKAVAENNQAATGALRNWMVDMAKTSGVSSDLRGQFTAFRAIAETHGMSIKDNADAFKWFTGELKDPEKIKKIFESTDPKTMWKGVADAAKTSLHDLVPPLSKLNEQAIGLSGSFGNLRNILDGLSKEGAPTGGAAPADRSPEKKRQDFQDYKTDKYMKLMQTGGLAPETGPYILHAGERVTRAGGSGGGLNISLGGINVSVGERGDLKGQLHEAMVSMEGRILRQIEEQWERAVLAR